LQHPFTATETEILQRTLDEYMVGLQLADQERQVMELNLALQETLSFRDHLGSRADEPLSEFYAAVITEPPQLLRALPRFVLVRNLGPLAMELVGRGRELQRRIFSQGMMPLWEETRDAEFGDSDLREPRSDFDITGLLDDDASSQRGDAVELADDVESIADLPGPLDESSPVDSVSGDRSLVLPKLLQDAAIALQRCVRHWLARRQHPEADDHTMPRSQFTFVAATASALPVYDVPASAPLRSPSVEKPPSCWVNLSVAESARGILALTLDGLMQTAVRRIEAIKNAELKRTFQSPLVIVDTSGFARLPLDLQPFERDELLEVVPQATVFSASVSLGSDSSVTLYWVAACSARQVMARALRYHPGYTARTLLVDADTFEVIDGTAVADWKGRRLAVLDAATQSAFVQLHLATVPDQVRVFCGSASLVTACAQFAVKAVDSFTLTVNSSEVAAEATVSDVLNERSRVEIVATPARRKVLVSVQVVGHRGPAAEVRVVFDARVHVAAAAGVATLFETCAPGAIVAVTCESRIVSPGVSLDTLCHVVGNDPVRLVVTLGIEVAVDAQRERIPLVNHSGITLGAELAARAAAVLSLQAADFVFRTELPAEITLADAARGSCRLEATTGRTVPAAAAAAASAATQELCVTCACAVPKVIRRCFDPQLDVASAVATICGDCCSMPGSLPHFMWRGCSVLPYCPVSVVAELAATGDLSLVAALSDMQGKGRHPHVPLMVQVGLRFGESTTATRTGLFYALPACTIVDLLHSICVSVRCSHVETAALTLDHGDLDGTMSVEQVLDAMRVEFLDLELVCPSCEPRESVPVRPLSKPVEVAVASGVDDPLWACESDRRKSRPMVPLRVMCSCGLHVCLPISAFTTAEEAIASVSLVHAHSRPFTLWHAGVCLPLATRVSMLGRSGAEVALSFMSVDLVLHEAVVVCGGAAKSVPVSVSYLDGATLGDVVAVAQATALDREPGFRVVELKCDSALVELDDAQMPMSAVEEQVSGQRLTMEMQCSLASADGTRS
jgi:hypothetical protein